MAQSGKHEKYRRGSALFSVVIVLSLVMVLAVALLGIVEASRSTVVTQYKQEQAHYSAKSALNAVVSYITDSGNAGAPLLNTIKSLPAGSYREASAALPDTMADSCRVKIEKLTADQVKITSTAAYLGETETASIVMLVKESTASVFEGFFTSTGLNGIDNAIDNSGWVISGETYFHDDDLVLQSTLNLDGSLINSGNLTLQNNSIGGTGDVISGGNMTLRTNNFNIDGDIWVKGDFETYSHFKANSVYVGGDFTVPWQKTIDADLYIAGDLIIPAYQSPRFNGKVVVSGRVIKADATFAQGYHENQPDAFAAQRAEKTTLSQDYQFWDEAKFATSPSSASYDIKLGNIYGHLEYTETYTISRSGILNSYISTDGGEKLIFDTTGGDIYLTIPASAAPGGTFSFDKGVHVETRGNGNVFILLKDNLSFRASSWGGIPIGNLNSRGQPQLFLISNSDRATFDFSNVSGNINAYIYAPKGIFKANDGDVPYNGGIVAGSFNIARVGARFKYIPPDPSVIDGGIGGGAPAGGGSGGGFSILPIYYGR